MVLEVDETTFLECRDNFLSRLLPLLRSCFRLKVGKVDDRNLEGASSRSDSCKAPLTENVGNSSLSEDNHGKWLKSRS